MDIEQTLRLACVPPEPRRDFEDTVMARVSAAAWRAAQARPRKSRRMLLIGSLFVAAAAAATFAMWDSGSQPPADVGAQTFEPAAPAAALTAAFPAAGPATPAAAPDMPPKVPSQAPKSTWVAEPCDAAAAALPAPPRYSVLVQPLQFESADPATQSMVQQYYSAVLDALRKVPGLALAGEGAPTTAGKPADFRVIVAAGGWGEQAGNTQRLRISVEAWNGSGFNGLSGTSRDIRTLDASSCPSAGAFNCGPVAAASFDVGSFVAQNRLPRYPTAAQAACSRNREILAQRNFELTRNDPEGTAALLQQGIERMAAASAPTNRANMWPRLRGAARPEAVPYLIKTLRETEDEAVRKEVLTVLAVKFAGDPGVREALAPVAAASADTLMRHVVERALSGDGTWIDYAAARLRDASLPAAQRLEAWHWMADAMSLDKEAMSATLARGLTALQQVDGVRTLANLLAGTQKDPAGPGYGLAGQLGQWSLRQIGSVSHPAATELLIICFDAEPNYITLSALATRRDDPRVAGKLESIAADPSTPQLARQAAQLLRQPLQAARAGPVG